jgi:hypothetical protein
MKDIEGGDKGRKRILGVGIRCPEASNEGTQKQEAKTEAPNHFAQ